MALSPKKKFFSVIISGPTASGKTELSQKIAEIIPSNIVNADTGQFYKNFSIGTAKPEWKEEYVEHHLFDIIEQPVSISAFDYKKLVFEKAMDCWNKKLIPIIVGGSLFYIKSLYFPTDPTNSGAQPAVNDSTWEDLYKVDQKRAQQIHPNDLYRINRALAIWKKTGKKPSEIKPLFNPGFNSVFIFLNLEDDFLYKRIYARTKDMIYKSGWIDEAEKLIGTPWEPFLKRRGFIGYNEIMAWIKSGRDKNKLPLLVEEIVCKTRQYARRQKIFWKSFKAQLKEGCDKELRCFVYELFDLKAERIKSLVNFLEDKMGFFEKKRY